MRIELQRVQYMPKALEPGVLYYAEEYGAAAHLCACGCGTKIRTPIGPTEWHLEDRPRGVSLSPSVGNWQHPCKSHYSIKDGEIRRAGQWTDQEIEAGRAREAERRAEYYSTKGTLKRKRGIFRRLWQRLSR
jgi:hypothetical protein